LSKDAAPERQQPPSAAEAAAEAGEAGQDSPDFAMNAKYLCDTLKSRVIQHTEDAAKNRKFFYLIASVNLACAALITCTGSIPLFKSSDSWVEGKKEAELYREGVTIVIGALNIFFIGLQNMMGFQMKADQHSAAAREYNALYRRSKLIFKIRDLGATTAHGGTWTVDVTKWPVEARQEAEEFLKTTRERISELEKQCCPPERETDEDRAETGQKKKEKNEGGDAETGQKKKDKKQESNQVSPEPNPAAAPASSSSAEIS